MVGGTGTIGGIKPNCFFAYLMIKRDHRRYPRPDFFGSSQIIVGAINWPGGAGLFQNLSELYFSNKNSN